MAVLAPFGLGCLITPDLLAGLGIHPVEAAVARAEEDRAIPISDAGLDPRLRGERPEERLPPLVEAIEVIVLAAEEHPVFGHGRFSPDPALRLERPPAPARLEIDDGDPGLVEDRLEDRRPVAGGGPGSSGCLLSSSRGQRRNRGAMGAHPPRCRAARSDFPVEVHRGHLPAVVGDDDPIVDDQGRRFGRVGQTIAVSRGPSRPLETAP